MRSYFFFSMLIVFKLSAIIDNDKQPLPTPHKMDITIGPPPGMGKLIANTQARAMASGELKRANDCTDKCLYGTIGVCSTIGVMLFMYVNLTKMSGSIY